MIPVVVFGIGPDIRDIDMLRGIGASQWLDQAPCASMDPRLFDATDPVLARVALNACARCTFRQRCLERVDPVGSRFDGVAAGRVWSRGRNVVLTARPRRDNRVEQMRFERQLVDPRRSQAVADLMQEAIHALAAAMGCPMRSVSGRRLDTKRGAA